MDAAAGFQGPWPRLGAGALDAVRPVRLESGASDGEQGSHVVECHAEGELHGSRVASALSQQVATLQGRDEAGGESVGVGVGAVPLSCIRRSPAASSCSHRWNAAESVPRALSSWSETSVAMDPRAQP
jgi:hypothetical protein